MKRRPLLVAEGAGSLSADAYGRPGGRWSGGLWCL